MVGLETEMGCMGGVATASVSHLSTTRLFLLILSLNDVNVKKLVENVRLIGSVWWLSILTLCCRVC